MLSSTADYHNRIDGQLGIHHLHDHSTSIPEPSTNSHNATDDDDDDETSYLQCAITWYRRRWRMIEDTRTQG
jgi:hypothetical protein